MCLTSLDHFHLHLHLYNTPAQVTAWQLSDHGGCVAVTGQVRAAQHAPDYMVMKIQVYLLNDPHNIALTAHNCSVRNTRSSRLAREALTSPLAACCFIIFTWRNLDQQVALCELWWPLS